jgi:nicotinamidase-related amidase
VKDLFLVIDMQTVYRPEEEWSCPRFKNGAENIRKLLDSPLCGEKYDVIFTEFVAAETPVGRWENYNEAYKDINEDSRLSEIDDSLKPYLKRWPLYSKSTYSSLSIPEIAGVLPDYDSVVLSGVVAECCVVATALALIDFGAHVTYLYDAVAGQNSENEENIRKLIESFSPIHTKVCSTEEYIKTKSSE